MSNPAPASPCTLTTRPFWRILLFCPVPSSTSMMAPFRRQNSQFAFQYSVPLETSGRPTRIIFRFPSAPYRARGTHPTLTAVYKNAPQTKYVHPIP